MQRGRVVHGERGVQVAGGERGDGQRDHPADREQDRGGPRPGRGELARLPGGGRQAGDGGDRGDGREGGERERGRSLPGRGQQRCLPPGSGRGEGRLGEKACLLGRRLLRRPRRREQRQRARVREEDRDHRLLSQRRGGHVGDRGGSARGEGRHAPAAAAHR